MISNSIDKSDSKVQDEIKNRCMLFIIKKCNDISKLFNLFNNVDEKQYMFDINRYHNKKIIVKGFIQSGKTNFIISCSILLNIFGEKDIVIIIRNSTDDKIQFNNRIKKYIDELKYELDGINLVSNIFIEIGNAYRLKKLNDKLKKDFVLFIDEVDFIDSVDTNATKELVKLKDRAYCNFGVSATIMDSIFKDRDVNLITLSKPDTYIGIERFNFNIISVNKIITDKSLNPIIDNENLYSYLEKLSLREPYYVPVYQDYHPIDTLIRVSLSLDPNRRLLSYISEKYRDIPSMFYSGGGTVELYIPNVNIPIKLEDGSVSKIKNLKTQIKGEKLFGLYHVFKSSSPSYVKRWLYENGGVKLYPRIITLVGRLASRCISYGASNFDECKKANILWWHLTEMYFSSSLSMDQPELLQTAGRLCVSPPVEDGIELTLYAKKDVVEDLIKSYMLQEELIDRSLQSCSATNNPLCDSIQEIPIYNKKIPKKRSLTKKIEYKINKVSTKKDFGYNFEKYNLNEEKDIANEIVDNMNSDYKEKTIIKIKKSLTKGTTCISIFLNHIDVNATYSDEELINLLTISGFKKPKSYIKSVTSISKYGFACIFEKVEICKWKIFEDFKSAWL